MPIHAFHCRKCDNTFDLLIRSTTVAVCPQCASDELDKLVSAPMPPGRSKGIIAAGRAAAAREGHFSNYSAADRAKAKR
jgi:putative FmdB family regulatory protein